MKWLKTLVAIWKGDLLKDELEKSRVIMDEARSVIDSTRATLGGDQESVISESILIRVALRD
jgi:hypothetical protein